MKIRYFDNGATTYVKEEVLAEMLPYYGVNYGNASAMYSVGREAKRGLDKARERVAANIKAHTNEIYFTSCGSESDNLAIKGVAYANKDKGKHIITTKIEHHAVLNSCKTLERQGYNITYLNVEEDGTVDLQQLVNSITPETILISVMFANNEIGTIEPIEQIGKIAKEHKIIFHTDAVQAIGNVRIDVQKLNIDLLSMSGHKFYAPKGVGALYVKEGINFEKIQDGGHQEKDKRAGTENVAQIVGMGKAIELIYDRFELYNKKLKSYRDYYFKVIEQNIPDIKINGARENRLPGNANISFKGVNAQNLLFKLDEVGICASAGSACSTGDAMPSHVLTSIGLDKELANGTLRVTFGDSNTKDDVEFLVETIKKLIPELRK